MIFRSVASSYVHDDPKSDNMKKILLPFLKHIKKNSNRVVPEKKKKIKKKIDYKYFIFF